MTTYLLSSFPTPLRAATQPPFLRAAGLGRVSKALLSTYLSQDRIYQEAYIRFIGSLLAKCRLEDELSWKIIDTLIEALKNIRMELDAFEGIAGKYGLNLEKGGGDGGNEQEGDCGFRPIRLRGLMSIFFSPYLRRQQVCWKVL